jgi:predicted dehydrogenase
VSTSSTVLRVGVLGAARVTPTALLRPAVAIEGVHVAAVAARDPRRARSFASKYSVPRVFEDYEQLLMDPHIDAVYIALPAALHARWMVKAIKAGKHVLCEKPFTSNAEAAQRVFEAADQSNVVVMEAYHSAYHPLQAQLRKVLAAGELGKVISARAVFCIPLLSKKAIQWNADLGGGGLLDVGYYPVRQLRDLFGEPTEIIAARAWQSHGVDRRLDASLRFTEGVRGEVLTAIMSRRLLASRLDIRGDAGRLRVTWPYHPQSGARMWIRTSRGKRSVSVNRRSSYVFQLEAFREAVESGAPPRTGAHEAVAQLTAIDRLYAAAGMQPRRDIR